MNEVADFFSKLLDTSDFPPRWHCGKWSEFHGWLYIISDLLIWGAYFAIPLIIIRYISRKSNARFQRVYVLFAAFILACGATHFLDAVIFWFPVYRLSALVRLVTAVASWATVFTLIRLLPSAFSLRSAEELEAEIEQRKKAEEKLKINNSLLTEAQEIARLGNWQWVVATDELVWSDTLYKMFEIDPQKKNLTLDDFFSRVHEDDKLYVKEMLDNARKEQVFPNFYYRIMLSDGSVKLMHAQGDTLYDDSGVMLKMTGTAQDVTGQKSNEYELRLKSQELEMKNAELENFASVASHDLKEPLRKIQTFASILETSHSEGMSAKAADYVKKMSGAAKRMHILIDDILSYSQLNGEQQPFAMVDLNSVLNNVLSDIEIAVSNSNAVIKAESMPTIQGRSTQLEQLFQNILSNAIKFRKENTAPIVNISSRVLNGPELPEQYLENIKKEFSIFANPKYWEKEAFCEIKISDNGIGFSEEFAGKVFVIFQRLHSHSEYEGTGIGLAICKKVVDLHHGSISVHSVQGEGTEFTILLPMRQH